MANIISNTPLDFKEAWDLANLEDIKYDLEWVKRAIEKYLRDFSQAKDTIIYEIFQSAIIIRYARAHINGSHSRIMPNECLEIFSAEEKDKHNYFIDLRNKHYGHSVNNYSMVICVAKYSNINSNSPKFSQIGFVKEYVSSLALKDMKDLLDLINKQLLWLESKINQEKEIVEQKVKNTPINQLRQWNNQWIGRQLKVKESRKRKLRNPKGQVSLSREP